LIIAVWGGDGSSDGFLFFGNPIVTFAFWFKF